MADYIDLKHQKLGEGICQKCGENFNELNYATLSLGTKSKSYVLCNNCLSKLQDKAQSFNHENKVDILPQKSEYLTEDKKPVNESYHVNELKPRDHESINKIQSSCGKTDAAECVRQDSNGGRQKEFDLDDTATYSLLKAEQRKIAGIYQSVLHSPLWGKGLEAKNLFAENHYNPDDIFHIIFVRFCDVAGYFWVTGSISFPLPLDMFGYIKGKNVKKEDSLYYSQKDVFNKYNDRDFSELVETVGTALLDWENKSLLTYSMAAATVYLRSDTEEAYDRIMLILADAALLHRDKPNQEYYDCSWSLWALLAAAIDFNNRYKRLISDQIVSKSKTNNSYKEQSKSENQQHSIFASNQTMPMSESQKSFNLDDPSTFDSLNAKQIEMANDYRRIIEDSKSGFRSKHKMMIDIINENAADFKKDASLILAFLCENCRYFYHNGPIDFPIPLDMFGYISGLCEKKSSQNYRDNYHLYTKYDNSDSDNNPIVLANNALIEWMKRGKGDFLVATLTAAFAYIINREKYNNEQSYDEITMGLYGALWFNDRQQNKKLVEECSILWCLVANAVGFDSHIKKKITQLILQVS